MPDSNSERIVVVGAGPGGMLAALGAAKKGYPVTILTKYAANTRPQKVKLDREAVQVLLEEADKSDEKFIKELKNTNGVVSISDVEDFLRSKVSLNHPNITIIDQVEIDHVDEDNDPPKITYSRTINGVGVSEELYFHHLLDASGTNRVTFKVADQAKIKKNEPSDSKTEVAQADVVDKPHFEEKYDPLAHTAQGTTVFQMSLGLEKTKWDRFREAIHFPPIYLPKFNKADLLQLQDEPFKWNEIYPPKTYILTNAARTEFYVGGEVPAHILNLNDQEKRKEMIMQWNKNILLHHFKIKDPTTVKVFSSLDESILAEHFRASKVPEEHIKKAVASHINLQNTSFHLMLSKLLNPVRLYKGKHVHTAIGDALADPLFHKGHGLNDALKSAHEFTNCLPTNNNKTAGFDIERFKKHTAKLLQIHDNRLFNFGREYEKKGDYSPRITLLNKEISLLLELRPLTRKDTERCNKLYKKCDIMRLKIIDQMVSLPFNAGAEEHILTKFSNQLETLNKILDKYSPAQKVKSVSTYSQPSKYSLSSNYSVLLQQRDKLWIEQEKWVQRFNILGASPAVTEDYNTLIQRVEFLSKRLEKYLEFLPHGSRERNKVEYLSNKVKEEKAYLRDYGNTVMETKKEGIDDEINDSEVSYRANNP